MRGLRLRVGAAVVLVAAVAGCTASPDRPSPPSTATSATPRVVRLPPEPPGLRISFVQQRFEEGTSAAEVRVENYSGEPLDVRRVGLDWPGYPTTLQARPYVVPDRTTIDLRTTLPAPRCDADVDGVRPVGVLRTSGGTVRRDLEDDGVRFLERIWRTRCSEVRLARAVDLTYGGPWRRTTVDGGPALLTSLRLVRRSGDAPLVVEAVQGSVLFDLALTGGRTLAPGAPSVDLPVRVTPGRCDDHARSQSSQTFTFRVQARSGDDPGLLSVVAVPTPAQQARLLAFLDDVC